MLDQSGSLAKDSRPARRRRRRSDDDEGVTTPENDTSAAITLQREGGPTCLLCRESFASVDALTTHCTNMHVKKGTFNNSFPCPECRRQWNPCDYLITSVSSWSGHVEMLHGYQNAPNLRTDPLPTGHDARRPCPFCGKSCKEQELSNTKKAMFAMAKRVKSSYILSLV
jgi:hypothetical protein